MCQDSARWQSAQLALDEAWQAAAAFAPHHVLEERRQMLSKGPMKNALLQRAWAVSGRQRR